MQNLWRTVAQSRWMLWLALIGCHESSTDAPQPDASAVIDGGNLVDASNVSDAADSSIDAATLEPVHYVTVPGDGGDCPLLEDISMDFSGPDLSGGSTLTLHAPATISKQSWDWQPENNESCIFPAPACGSQSRPDFADVLDLLARPEFVELRAQGSASFGQSRYPHVSSAIHIGTYPDIWSITIYDEAPPRCSTLNQDADAGGEACIPDVVAEFFDLLRAFTILHNCR